LIAATVLVALLGLVGFTVFAWRSAIAPITPPPPSAFSAALVAQGEVLASGGYCAACHTRKGGRPLAGGLAMATQFGTIYSTNITPDTQTGIGTWSEAAFRRAMHEGVARDGSHLFPAFPYDHFTKLGDADVSALYAFLMTRPAVAEEPHRNTVPFPLSIRALQAGWKLLFFREGRYRQEPARSPEWNRGAYLAEGLSHCSACHTPRNILGGEKRGRAYAGAAVDNWIAPPLDASNPSPGAWDVDELHAYLTTGVAPFHATSAGPMAPVVRGLAKLPDSDVLAIAAYIASLNGSAGRAGQKQSAVVAALAKSRIGTGLQYDPGARLYTAACASCHYNSGKTNPLRPEMALTTAVNLDEPTNLIQVILFGITGKDGAPGIVMPAFGRGMSDADVARIAAYLRTSRTDRAPWADLEKKVADVRALATEQDVQP
jgi:mono/diheme cytochrome c family protein